MSLQKMKAIKCPTEELNQTNFATVCPHDFDDIISYVEVNTGVGSFVFSIKRSGDVPTGSIGFNLLQRLWTVISIGQDIDVRPFVIDTDKYTLTSVALEVDFLPKIMFSWSSKPYDTNGMAYEFLEQFRHQTLSIGQQLFFSFQGTKMLAVVKDLKILDVNGMPGGGEDIIACKSPIGVISYCWCCSPIPVITFDKAEGSSLNLVDLNE